MLRIPLPEYADGTLLCQRKVFVDLCPRKYVNNLWRLWFNTLPVQAQRCLWVWPSPPRGDCHGRICRARGSPSGCYWLLVFPAVSPWAHLAGCLLSRGNWCAAPRGAAKPQLPVPSSVAPLPCSSQLNVSCSHPLRKRRGQSVSDGVSRASLRVFAVKPHWQCCGGAALSAFSCMG